MNSRKDLIKAILRYSSDEYKKEQLEKISDEELVYIKLKAEKRNPALKSASFQKQIGKALARKRKKKR
ncbi:MAG TPA: hypothetical protein VI757_06105 [Bacteroidia bacterium]|nr:hypothetical protein [Bacteroidia bacterium]